VPAALGSLSLTSPSGVHKARRHQSPSSPIAPSSFFVRECTRDSPRETALTRLLCPCTHLLSYLVRFQFAARTLPLQRENWKATKRGIKTTPSEEAGSTIARPSRLTIHLDDAGMGTGDARELHRPAVEKNLQQHQQQLKTPERKG
jgi:hypothetical protein